MPRVEERKPHRQSAYAETILRVPTKPRACCQAVPGPGQSDPINPTQLPTRYMTGGNKVLDTRHSLSHTHPAPSHAHTHPHLDIAHVLDLDGFGRKVAEEAALRIAYA